MKYFKETTLTKEIIQKKLETVYRQLEFNSSYHCYIPKLKNRENELFSNDVSLYNEARRQIAGLIHYYRTWDSLDNLRPDEDPSNDFVDDFKNLDEFFDFTQTILDDIDEYIKERS